MGRAEVAVGNDEDVETVGDRLVGGGAECFKAFLEACAAVFGDEERIKRGGFESAERHLAELRELLVVDERIVETDQSARMRAGIEQVAFRAEEGLGGGDEFFANAIERRVGDLGEDLFEVLIEVFRFVRKHREGCVVAHRGDWLNAGGGGGPEQHAEILVGVTKGELTLEHAIAFDGFRCFWRGKILDENTVFIEPLFVGLGRVDAFFHFLIRHDASFVHVDEEHAAGLEPAFLHDGEWVEIGDDADFRSHDDEVVLRHIITARAETIAIEHGANLATIGEGDRGRAIPWLHHASVELVESFFVLIHHRVTLPRFGDHHHHRVDQIIAAEVHELEGVVEACRVGSVFDDDWENAGDVAVEKVALAECLTGLHEVGVAHDRVDFAVVGNEAVRVRA